MGKKNKHYLFLMDCLGDTKAENKVVRRNALRKILAFVEKSNPMSEMESSLFYSHLLFEDEYDTSRELSYKIADIVFQYIQNEDEFDSIAAMCFSKIQSNSKSKGNEEVEAVRIGITQVLANVLTRGSVGFLKKRIDDIVSILRVYLIDPSPEVVIPLISKFQQFITHMHSEIHMVVEALVRLLVGLLGRRQRPIRAGAIRSIRQLIEMDGDRNGIIVEDIQDSLLRTLGDADEQNRFEVICLMEHCLRNELYKDTRLVMLETLASIRDDNERNQFKIDEILQSSIA